MTAAADGLQAALDKMRADGAQPVAVDTFQHYFERLRSGEAGVLREDELEPVSEVPDLDGLPQPSDDEARASLDQAVVLKLNGGLGTGMGMTRAKSLLDVKDGLTFLDVVARQVRRPGRRRPARLRAEPCPEDRRRRPAARVLARERRSGVGAARARRPL